MASAALWPYFKELLFIFRVCRALRSAPNAFSQEGLLWKMPFAVATPPVRRQFWKIRRFSRIANIKIYFPLKMARAQRRPFKSFTAGISIKTTPGFSTFRRKDVEKPGRAVFTESSAVGAGVVHDLGGGQLTHGRAAQGIVQLGTVGGKSIVQLLALHVA